MSFATDRIEPNRSTASKWTDTKRPSGPLPSLLSALRSDNRSQLLDVLEHRPKDCSSHGTRNTLPTVPGLSSESSVNYKQRLLFGTSQLRTLLLRHVLLDEISPDSPSKKTSTAKSTLSAEEESWGLTANNPWGIVGTRVLRHSPRKDYDVSRECRRRFKSIHDGSTESAAVEVHVHDIHGDENDEDANDKIRDSNDGAQMAVYFIRPDPVHIKAVAKRIRRYQKYSPSSNQPPIHRHRIIFLPHIHELAKRFLYEERIISSDSSDVPTATTGVTIHSLPIDLVPLDEDVITCLEHEGIIKETDILGIPSDAITLVAKSLLKIQCIAGIIPRIQSWGMLGEKVLEKMMALRLEDYQNDELWQTNEEDDEEESLVSEKNLSQEQSEPSSSLDSRERIGHQMNSNDIAALIIFDRKIDLITPMLTPLTYEGLLDDILGIDCGFIKVDANIIDPPTDEAKNATGTVDSSTRYVSIPLNDNDSLYAEVRNQHVEKFGKFLQGQAKALKESHATFTDKNKKDLAEIHQFVKQIPIFTKSVKSLTNYIHLAELIKATTEQAEFRSKWQTERSMLESESCYDTIDDLIAIQFPPYRLLKLVCLQSLTSGGIKASRYDWLRREIIQTYGFEFLFVLQNLERLGILRRKDSIFDSTSPFASLRKQLSLIEDDTNTNEPNDIAYVSSGYAPITARLIQISMQGSVGKEEALRELPGRGIDVLQSFPPDDLFSAMKRGSPECTLAVWAMRFSPRKPIPDQSKSEHLASVEEARKPVLLVYFIGGITYMEIAALRFLSRKSGFPYNILVCTTKVIDGSSFLESLS